MLLVVTCVMEGGGGAIWGGGGADWSISGVGAPEPL